MNELNKGSKQNKEGWGGGGVGKEKKNAVVNEPKF